MTTKQQINLILKKIGKYGFSGKSVAATNYTEALSKFIGNDLNLSEHKKINAELRRQKLVEFSKSGKQIKLNITPAGAYRLQKLKIDELGIIIPKKWDRKWRIVIFDIPLTSSTNRTYFTLHLKKLGLKMVQKSVWVHPYNCYEEVQEVASFYNLNRYCSFFEVDKIDGLTQKRLKQLFKI